jgi:hypothetical protein
MTYAGIGSRDTPEEVLELMRLLGAHLAKKRVILRSGGAKGADQAFEEGCDIHSGPKEIYLPWKGFEGSTSPLFNIPSEAFTIAEKFHPYWGNLSQGAQKLQARNSLQVLGENLSSPVDFLLCYTKGGKGGGGTGQALRIAKSYNIPIFDFGKYSSIEEMKSEYLNFTMKIKSGRR